MKVQHQIFELALYKLGITTGSGVEEIEYILGI